MRERILVVLLLSGLTAADTPVFAESEAPKIWNGRDHAKEVTAAFEAYAGADAEKRAELRAFLDDLGFLRAKDVKPRAKAFLKIAKKRGLRISKKDASFTFGGLTGRIRMQGKAKRGRALVIALHGGGKGAGDGKNAMQKWGGPIGSNALVIAPTAPELRDVAWNAPDIEAWVIALMQAAIRSFDLDTNRVYLVGHSMGGFGTWSIGPHHADRFAALAACAGGVFSWNGKPAPGTVANLLDTPVYFYHSTDDPKVGPEADQIANEALAALKAEGYPYKWVYEEYDDIGHGLPKKGLKPIVDWLFEHERDPYPTHVIWEPHAGSTRDRMFWVGQTSRTWIEGRIEDNEITLTTKGPTRDLTVYLHRTLVDFDKPIKIVKDGDLVFEGGVSARLSVLVHTIATGEDPKQWYAHAVRLD